MHQLKLWTTTGLALTICLLTALIDVSIVSKTSFANPGTWLRCVLASAILLATVTAPACALTWAFLRGVRGSHWSSDTLTATATCVVALVIPVSLYAIRAVQLSLPAGVGPLSPLGLAANGAVALFLVLLGLAAFFLFLHLGLGETLSRNRNAIAVVGWAALFVAVIVTTYRPTAGLEPSAPRRPNVLIISVDSVRADVFWEHLDSHAAEPLRRFVAEGRRYRRSYTTYSHSLASHASMFTGLYPPEHGAISRTTPAGVIGSALAIDTPLLAERFQEAGYETIGVMSNDWLAPPYGIESGFQTYVLHGRALELAYFDWSIVESVSMAGFYKSWIEKVLIRRSHWNTRIFLSWLSNRARSRPFFAFLHYIDMHVPNNPAGRFRAAIDHGPFADLNGEQLEARIDAGEIPERQMAAALRRIRDLNRARLAEVETALEPVLMALMEEGWLDDTLVILTSDHGDNLYEKTDTYGHNHVYETSGRVPLVARGPGVQAGEDDRLTSAVDLAPTVYRFAGVEAPERLSGIDFLAGEPRSSDRGDWIYLQGSDTRHEAAWARAVVWADGKKFIRDPEVEQFFDLSVDPTEQNDLITASPELAAALRTRFEAALGSMRVAGAGAPIPIEDLPERAREGLQALGYIE